MLSNIQKGGCVTKMTSKYIVLVFFFISLTGRVVQNGITSAEDKLVLLEHTVQSLQQTVHTLQRNVSDMRQTMATADVLRLYLTQEIGYRDELKMQLMDLANNYTILQDLYNHSNLAQQRLKYQLQELSQNHSKLQSAYSITIEKQQELTHSLSNLMRNISSFQSEYKRSSSQLHKNISDMSSEFQTSFTAMTVLYNDDLQQTCNIKQKQSTLEQEIRQFSISLLDLDTKRKNVNDSLWNSTEHISQKLSSLQQQLVTIGIKQKNDNDALRNSTGQMQQTFDVIRRNLDFNISTLQKSLNQLKAKGWSFY